MLTQLGIRPCQEPRLEDFSVENFNSAFDVLERLSRTREDTFEEDCAKLLTSGLNLWTVGKEVSYNMRRLFGL